MLKISRLTTIDSGKKACNHDRILCNLLSFTGTAILYRHYLYTAGGTFYDRYMLSYRSHTLTCTCIM